MTHRQIINDRAFDVVWKLALDLKLGKELQYFREFWIYNAIDVTLHETSLATLVD